MKPKQKNNDTKGCVKVLLTSALAFAAMEGGIVLSAEALYAIASGHPESRIMALEWLAAGLILIIIAPLIIVMANRVRPVIKWQQVTAALPDFALAAWFVIGWAAPRWIGQGAAELLSGIVALEFIIIHASVGLVGFPAQIAKDATDHSWWRTPRGVVACLLIVYSIFAACISMAFKTIWLFVSFWLLIGNKFIDDWLAPVAEAEERKNRHVARWGLSALIYLLLAFGSIFIPVPRLNAYRVTDGDGLWDANPEQAVAMGAMYFTILGFCELFGFFRIKKTPEARADR